MNYDLSNEAFCAVGCTSFSEMKIPEFNSRDIKEMSPRPPASQAPPR